MGGRLLTVTGAGISRASGIPTFRGSEPGAVWSRHDVELATFDYFERDPVGQWRWYLERFDSVDRAHPNAAHLALASLSEHCRSLGGDPVLVTQNIDCLHEAAGSRDVIKVHGSSDRVRCSAAGRCQLAAPAGSLSRGAVDLRSFRAEPTLGTVPRCPTCGAALRAHVLFFDEYYGEHVDYRFGEVERAAATCDAVLFVGTSFSVGVTDLVLRQAMSRRRPIVSIDPAGPPAGRAGRAIQSLAAAAEEALPEIVSCLGGRE